MNALASIALTISELEDTCTNLRARISELESENAALRELQNIPEAAAPVFGFTVSENNIFNALMAREIISEDGLMSLLYSARADNPPMDNVISVFLCKIRRKLKPFGVTIHNRKAHGWLISREHKARIREQLDGQRKDAA